MTFNNQFPDRAFTIHNEAPDPTCIILKGRDRWALEALVEAGCKGCTPIDNPAPRWAAYVHNLRARGVAIDTITENHGGPFAGTHARYVLRCNVTDGMKCGAA